jgi:hypothetical protein
VSRCGGKADAEQRKKTGGLGLMQGKQSSTMPSPAAPTPIPWWRFDHGWLWLGRRRPWLGLLRIRSGHARADDDEDVRLRPPPRMALPQRLQLLPPSSLSDFGATTDGLGKIPQGRRRIRGRLADRMGLGIYRAVAARVFGRQMDGRRTLASVPRRASRGHGRARCEARDAALARRPCITVGKTDREREKVGMRLTVGPTWR